MKKRQPIDSAVHSVEEDLIATAARRSDGGVRRLLLVVDGCYPSTGGAERQVSLLSTAFKETGHEVIILAPRIKRGQPLREILSGVPVVRIPYPRVKVLGGFILCLRFAMYLLAHRRHYDAIHVHMVRNLGTVAGLMRPILRGTLAMKISGAWEFEGGLLDPILSKKTSHRIMNWCVKRADFLQCVSEYTRRRMLDLGYAADQLALIPNAVDLRHFAPSPWPRPSPQVAFVGRLRPVKGLLVLLEAWARVVETFPAHLVLAGDGPQRIDLEQKVQELGLGSHVTFIGETSDVAVVLRQSLLYVQPSFQEGMPNSVLEAMACGLAIVASRVSGNEDLVRDGYNGLLVPAGSAELLAAAIARLLGDTQTAREMGKMSRAIVEAHYSLPAVVNQLLNAYRIGGRP